MPKAVYLNVLVNDLPRAERFFKHLGIGFDEDFCDDQAMALVVADNFYAMLHTADSIARFSRKAFVANKDQSEVLISLQVDSRAEVDRLLEKAIEAGASEHREVEDHGYKYIRCFEDLDGHLWEPFWMGDEDESEGEV